MHHMERDYKFHIITISYGTAYDIEYVELLYKIPCIMWNFIQLYITTLP